MSSSTEEQGSSKEVPTEEVPSKEVPTEEGPSTKKVRFKEVPTEECPSKEVLTDDEPMTQNPLYGDTDDEEDVLVVPRLKEPFRSATDGTWRLQIYSSSDDDDDYEESEEEEEEAGEVSWSHMTPGVTEVVDGGAEDCSYGAAQDGGSNEFRMDR